MKRYWFVVLAVATLLSVMVYKHQSRPFSEVEWTSDWDGGPDPDSKEYRGSIAAGEMIARKRQAAAPYQSGFTFGIIIGLGAALRVVQARLLLRRD